MGCGGPFRSSSLGQGAGCKVPLFYADRTLLRAWVLPREKRQMAEKTMKVLLTGGSGDLGRTLVPRLLDKGDTPVILDVRAPRDLKQGAVFIEGVYPGPAEVDGNISLCPHSRVARYPRRSWREK